MHPESSNTPAVERFGWNYNTLSDPMLSKALVAVKAFASAMDRKEPARWLSILGTSGVGKTHLAKALLRFWRERAGWEAKPAQIGSVNMLGDSVFVSWLAFLNRQRNGEYGEVANLKNIQFVVIDDIGTDRDSDFAKEKLYQLVSAREGKWTVITSNLSLAQIASGLDTRISSRMLRGGSVVVNMSGVTDYNLRTRMA